MTDCIRVAFYNLSADKRTRKKIVFGMTVIFILALSFAAVMRSYDQYKTEFDQKHQKDCYCYVELEEQEIVADQLADRMEEQKKLSARYSAADILTIYTMVCRDETMDVSAGKIKLIWEGEEHGAKYSMAMNQASRIRETIEGASDPLELAYFQKGMEAFRGYPEGMIAGRYPEEPGEILLDDYILGVYGLDIPAEDMVGKEISLYYHDEEKEEYLLKNYIVAGIFDSRLLFDRESPYTPDLHREHLYVNLKEGDRGDFKIGYGSVRYYYNSFADYVSAYDRSEDLIRLNLTDILSGEGEVQVTPKGIEYCVIFFLMENVGKVLLLLAVVIGLIILFSVFYLFYFYWNRQKRYRIMLTCIGMRKKDRRRIRGVEVFLLSVLSLAIAVYFSALLLMILNYFSTLVLDFPISLV